MYVGVDIGGTEIKITVLKDGEDITARFNTEAEHKKRRRPTDAYLDKNAFNANPDFTYEGFIATVEDLIRSVLKETGIPLDDVQAIGFSWAGAIRNNKVAASSKVPMAMKGAGVDYSNYPQYRKINAIVNSSDLLKEFFKIEQQVEKPGYPREDRKGRVV